jgi:hypothetical protein
LLNVLLQIANKLDISNKKNCSAVKQIAVVIMIAGKPDQFPIPYRPVGLFKS